MTVWHRRQQDVQVECAALFPVLALEDAVVRGLLPGLSIGRIEQYTRQVTIAMELPRDMQERGRARRRRDIIRVAPGKGSAGGVDGIRIIALIVRYPFRGMPSFATRGLEGGDEAATGAEISSELDAIATNYFRPSSLGHFAPHGGGVGASGTRALLRALSRPV